MLVVGRSLALTAAVEAPVIQIQGPPQAPKLPALTFAFTLRVQVGPPTELGEMPAGRRRIIPILGGTFEGPSIRGKVLAGGADWQSIQADGLARLDTRYTLLTDTG